MIRTSEKLIQHFQMIQAQQLMRHVRILAGDDLRGRMPGDSGYRMAMDYVTGFFKTQNLQPGFPNGQYEQAFKMETCRICLAEVSVSLGGSNPEPLELGTDYVCRGLTGNGDVTGELAFVGYCCEEDDFNELNSVDLRGKIAVSFKHSPAWWGDRPQVLPREKAHRLAARGARGLVIVPNPNRKEQDRLSASLVEKGEYIPDFPMIVLADHLADRLFSFNDTTLSERQFRTDTRREIMSCPVPASIRIRIDTEHQPAGTSWNAAAFLPGADADLAHEVIVIGAHLDHVGIQGERVIFNGAQDNASGAAAVLELARAFAGGSRPARSLQFVLFGAEEAGLIGSMHYAAHPGQPLDHTRAMLNLDCMGAGDGVDMRGRKAYPELFRAFDKLNDHYVQIPATSENHAPGGADAKPFEDAGIPNMYFVGSNPYRHLHMASDKPETLNPSLFESISRLAYLMAATLSSGDQSV